MKNKFLLLMLTVSFFSCSKNEPVQQKDLKVNAYYQTSSISGIKQNVPDNGAICYLFENFNIHAQQFTANADGTITLANGETLTSSKKQTIDANGNAVFTGISLGSPQTVLCVSKMKYPKRNSQTTIIRNDDAGGIKTDFIEFVFE